MFKVDLHTHSTVSPDGGISPSQYQAILESNTLDALAITDHNTIDMAVELKKQFGERIIIGEEIMTTHGEIIGLFLSESVPAGLTPTETVKRIKDQNGLVYIPHPFETVRKGLSVRTLEEIADYVDIIEVCNGRAFVQNRSSQGLVWARLNQKDGAASSDAHGYKGLGKTYSDLPEMPTRENLLAILGKSILRTGRPSIQSLLYPKYHRVRKKLGRQQ